MASYAYDRLSALDHSFLLLEKPSAYMHVASTLIFEAGPLRTSSGGIHVGAIRRSIEASLHKIPRYRQKLAWIPVEDHPVWVDDDRFFLDYHIRHTSLPQPGTEEQLKRLSARIMAQHLDRNRPLWEMWIVEGLEGDRFALISKVHHCMIDGVSGVDLMKILLSASPEENIADAPQYIPRPAPSALSLLRDEVIRRVSLPLRVVRDLGSLWQEAQDSRRQLRLRLRSLAETLGASLKAPSRTPLNQPIGPHRRFDWLRMDLEELRSMRRILGGSLNDVVLTVVAGAMRRFLSKRQGNLRDMDFRVMAPVSIRTEDEAGTMGNRVSAWIVDLPIAERDPRRQLALIREQTEKLKKQSPAVAANLLTQVADWTPSTLLALGARNVTRLLPFNMVVTNVPGPQFPIYMLGARMLSIFPHVPLADHLGLCVALMSYDGQLCWGVNADYDLVPDVADFLADVDAAFQELRWLANTKEAPDALENPSQPAFKAPDLDPRHIA